MICSQPPFAATIVRIKETEEALEIAKDLRISSNERNQNRSKDNKEFKKPLRKAMVKSQNKQYY